MANSKIISFVDYQINAALNPVHDDIETQRADIMRSISILTDRIRDTRLSLTNAIADNTLTLRHDINALATALKYHKHDDAEAAADKLLNTINMLTDRINQLRQEIDQLKQGGGTPQAK